MAMPCAAAATVPSLLTIRKNQSWQMQMENVSIVAGMLMRSKRRMSGASGIISRSCSFSPARPRASKTKTAMPPSGMAQGRAQGDALEAEARDRSEAVKTNPGQRHVDEGDAAEHP